MKNDKTKAAFIVYDYDGDLKDLTKFIGLEPTKILEEQADLGHAKQWCLESQLSESEELENHLDGLLTLLNPKADQINELSKKYRCVITVGIEYYQYNPEIALSPELISSLSNLGVKLWLDIYNMWDGETDHPSHDERSKL